MVPENIAINLFILKKKFVFFTGRNVYTWDKVLIPLKLTVKFHWLLWVQVITHVTGEEPCYITHDAHTCIVVQENTFK